MASLAAALILALVALPGCMEMVQGPLAPPSSPRYLTDPLPRDVGPLRPVPESEVRVVQRGVPAGATVVYKSAFDMDSMVRASNRYRTIERRFTQHQGRAFRVKALGPTERSPSRLRVDYAKDEKIEQTGDASDVRKRTPVDGNSYVVEVAPRGAWVSTAAGARPRPDEVSLVLSDSVAWRSLSSGGGLEVTAALVTRQVRSAMVREGMDVGHLNVAYQGVRDVAGAPCAVFEISVGAALRKEDDTTSTFVEMKLSGEYAFRLSDGWEADLLLTGSTLMSGSVRVRGISIPVASAGVARFQYTARYRDADAPPAGEVAGR